MIPLPFTCQRHAYTDGVEDDHGNTVPGWVDPVAVACFWWSAASTEPRSEPTGGDLVTVDLALVVDIAQAVDHRDQWTVDGRKFNVVGLPKDWDHGPFGYQPNRQILELKWVG